MGVLGADDLAPVRAHRERSAARDEHAPTVALDDGVSPQDTITAVEDDGAAKAAGLIAELI